MTTVSDTPVLAEMTGHDNVLEYDDERFAQVVSEYYEKNKDANNGFSDDEVKEMMQEKIADDR